MASGHLSMPGSRHVTLPHSFPLHLRQGSHRSRDCCAVVVARDRTRVHYRGVSVERRRRASRLLLVLRPSRFLSKRRTDLVSQGSTPASAASLLTYPVSLSSVLRCSSPRRVAFASITEEAEGATEALPTGCEGCAYAHWGHRPWRSPPLAK